MHTRYPQDESPRKYTHTDRKSYSAKKAYDFRWVEDMADYWYQFIAHPDEEELQEKYRLNADLYNGRWPAENRFLAQDDLSLHGDEFNFLNSSESIQHYNILSPIVKSLVGEQQKRPFKPISIDRSIYGYNQRKDYLRKGVQKVLEENVLNPLREQMARQYMEEHGIEDLFQLEPEQQEQMQNEVESRTMQEAPEDVLKSLRKNYKGSAEKLGQECLRYFISEHDPKYYTDEGFKQLMLYGGEVFYVNTYEGRSIFNLRNYPNFRAYMKPDAHFFQEAEACYYEDEITYTELFNLHGEEISKSKYKNKLDNIIHGLLKKTGEPSDRVVAEIAANPDKFGVRDINIRTREGQQAMASAVASTSMASRSNFTVHTRHVCFKSLRKYYRVLRVMDDGQIKRYWVAEHYRKNPALGDIEAKEVWLPEAWETKVVGYTKEAIYLNKRRIPWQYKNHDDPFNILLPYTGANYSTLMGMSKNVAPLDLGKPWQDSFDIEVAKMKELDQLDWGNIFVMGKKMKPKEYSWGEWLKMVKYGKLAIMDDIESHMSQLVKAVNMSTAGEVQNRLERLDYYYSMAARAMSYNTSRLGEVSPYMTVTNNQQNIIQSSHQTENIFNLHNKVVEQTLNVGVRTVIQALKDNPEERTYVLSDNSVGLLTAEPYLLDLAKFTVKMSIDPDDYEKLLEIKRDLPNMLGGGQIEFDEYIKMKWAENPAEILNAAEESRERREQQMQQQQEAEEARIQKQEEMQNQMFQMKAQLKLLMQDKDLAAKKYMAEVDATKFAAQYDINNNNINDTYEREMEKLKEERRQFDEEMKLKIKELNNNIKMEAEKLRIEKIKAKNKKST